MFVVVAAAFAFHGFFVFVVGRGHAQGAEDFIQGDAVSVHAFFQGLKVGDGATEAAHTEIFENLYRVRIFLDDFADAHVFGDHVNLH